RGKLGLAGALDLVVVVPYAHNDGWMGRVGRRAVVDLAAEVDESHDERFRSLLLGTGEPAWRGLNNLEKSTSKPRPEVRVGDGDAGPARGQGGLWAALRALPSPAVAIRPWRSGPGDLALAIWARSGPGSDLGAATGELGWASRAFAAGRLRPSGRTPHG